MFKVNLCLFEVWIKYVYHSTIERMLTLEMLIIKFEEKNKMCKTEKFIRNISPKSKESFQIYQRYFIS